MIARLPKQDGDSSGNTANHLPDGNHMNDCFCFGRTDESDIIDGGSSMKKLVFLLIMIALLTVSIVPAMAATQPEAPVMFNTTFTVTSAGGTYQVGFVKVEFPKNFMGKNMPPITFDASVYALDGQGAIEFSPDVAAFIKNVKIKVSPYKGFLYDQATGKNIYVNFHGQMIWASHFSRYCWH